MRRHRRGGGGGAHLNCPVSKRDVFNWTIGSRPVQYTWWGISKVPIVARLMWGTWPVQNVWWGITHPITVATRVGNSAPARWSGAAFVDTAVGVTNSARALGHTLKDDLVNINGRSFLNSAISIGTSLSGNAILSGERIYSWAFIWKAIALSQVRTYAPNIITQILPGSIAFSLFGSFANFCLIKEDERRRRAGQSPILKEDYNSLCLMFTHPLETTKAVFHTLNNNYRSLILLSLLTVTGTAAVCYYSYGSFFAASQLIADASPTIGQFFNALPNLEFVNQLVPYRIVQFDLLSLCLSVPTLLTSYLNRATDTYSMYTSLQTVKQTLGNNWQSIPIEKEPHVEAAIKAIAQRSGPIEQLIASAIILHDANLDLMDGGNGPHHYKHLFESSTGICQTIANRNNALVNLMNLRPQVALAGISAAERSALYASITPAQIAAVTQLQITGVNQNNVVQADINAVTPAQIAAANITGLQAAAINPARLARVTPHITPQQLAAVTAAQLGAVGLPDTPQNRQTVIATIVFSLSYIITAADNVNVNRNAIINTINKDITDVLTEQNSKDLITDNYGVLKQENVRRVVTRMAQRIQAKPGCANIVNIDEAVKLVTLADKAVVASRERSR